MAGPVFADGDVPTGSNFNDYLGAKGLLKTVTSTAGDITVTNSTAEQLIDTINNIAVGPGCTANRAIKLTWMFMGTVSNLNQFNFKVRAYYKAASSFGTIAGATQFSNSPMSFDWENFKDDISTVMFMTSLAPATTYSFGLSIQRITTSASAVDYAVRGSSDYPRRAYLEDAGLGTLIS